MNLLSADKTKGPLSSLGITGPLVSMLVMGAGFLWGPDVLRPEHAQEVVSNAEMVYLGVTGIVGAVTGIIGRWRATKKIGGGNLG